MLACLIVWYLRLAFTIPYILVQCHVILCFILLSFAISCYLVLQHPMFCYFLLSPASSICIQLPQAIISFLMLWEIQVHMGPYGTIGDHAGPCRSIWDHTGPSRTKVDHTGYAMQFLEGHAPKKQLMGSSKDITVFISSCKNETFHRQRHDGEKCFAK